jgi:hypothetical protein
LNQELAAPERSDGGSISCEPVVRKKSAAEKQAAAQLGNQPSTINLTMKDQEMFQKFGVGRACRHKRQQISKTILSVKSG